MDAGVGERACPPTSEGVFHPTPVGARTRRPVCITPPTADYNPASPPEPFAERRRARTPGRAVSDQAHLQLDDGFGGPEGEPFAGGLHQLAELRQRDGDGVFDLLAD